MTPCNQQTTATLDIAHIVLNNGGWLVFIGVTHQVWVSTATKTDNLDQRLWWVDDYWQVIGMFNGHTTECITYQHNPVDKLFYSGFAFNCGS